MEGPHDVLCALLQHPPSADYQIDKDENMYAGAIVLKTNRPMPEMEELARKTLAGINPNLSVVRFQTFTAQIADQFSEERMLSRLTMLFGGLPCCWRRWECTA